MLVRRIKIIKRREYKQVSRLGILNIDRLTANDKDFSTALEMTIRESLKSPSLPVTSHQSLLIPAFKLLGIPFSRIVISSVSEKSFLQADKRCMCESRNTQHQGVVSLSMPM